jgi:hypothetical protein
VALRGGDRAWSSIRVLLSGREHGAQSRLARCARLGHGDQDPYPSDLRGRWSWLSVTDPVVRPGTTLARWRLPLAVHDPGKVITDLSGDPRAGW